MRIKVEQVTIGLFVVLLAAALVFCRERMLFGDASFILFRLINQNALQIQEHRYGAFITQLVPLVAARLHLTMGMIVVLYSVSFTLFYLVVAGLLAFRFREKGLAVLMGLYQVVLASDTFFWTNNEVHQGIAWMFLLFGMTTVLAGRAWYVLMPVFTVLAFLSLFSHLLVAFPTFFLWLYFLLSRKWAISSRQAWMLSLILLVTALSRFWLSVRPEHSFYDVDRLQAVTHPTLKALAEMFFSPMVRELVKRMAWNYWLLPVLLGVGLFTAWKQRRYPLLVLTLGFALAYVTAVCLTFSNFLPFYTESEWMPFTIIAAALFVFEFLPRLGMRTAAWVLAAIFSIRLAYIGSAAPKWIDRRLWLEARLQQMRSLKITKAVVYKSEQTEQRLLMDWAVPIESLLSSALSGDRPRISFVVLDQERLSLLPAEPQLLLTPFETLRSAQLNHRYFNFDTTTAYREMSGQKKVPAVPGH